MNFNLEKASPGDIPDILNVMVPFNMHHVPSPEMDSLDPDCFFVARIERKIVGAAGYKILSPVLGKTTLLAVLPEYSGFGIGKGLQQLRMETLHKAGIIKLQTNADRPDTILWYKKHFGYREIGKLRKISPFGLDSVDHWTTLETDLNEYFRDLDSRNQRRASYMARYDAHPLAPYPPLIINVCLTGMVPTKIQSAHVPLSCEEIIADAISVIDAGASMIHIHARDNHGEPTPDPKLYERIITGIRKERRNVICTVTTSGRNHKAFEQRSAVLYLDGDAKPDMASLTTGSLNFLTGPSTNSIEMVERLAMVMKERGIMPELEVFDLGMVNLSKYLERNGLLPCTKYYNILLGNLNSSPATMASLAAITASLPDDSVWSAAGLGLFQLPMNAMAITAGGHVRVGLEDSLYYDYMKSRLTTNTELVERVVRISGELQRPVAIPREARTLLGLPQR